MAQIVSITLGTQPGGVTAFNLQFSADGGVTWTPYSTVSATPSTPEDLSTGLLTAGVYTVDGVNSPSGNQALASAPGLLYEARWKGAGGYGNWSAPFIADAGPVPAAWGNLWAETVALLYEGGRALPAVDPLLRVGIAYEIPRVIAYVEGPPAPDGTGGTGRSFTPTVEQRLFDGSGANSLEVFDLVPADQGGSAITVVTMPGSVPLTGAPVPVAVRNGLTEGWDRLALQWDGAAVLPRFPLGRRNIGVTATWGYRATVPVPLAGAVCAEVARLVIVGSQGPLQGLGTTTSMGPLSDSNAAGVSIWPQSSPIGVNHDRFLEVVRAYRDPRALDRVRFGPQAVRALWGR